MKRLILAAALLMPLSATAEERSVCEMVTEESNLIMQARQAGVPLKDTLKHYESGPAFKQIILDAYKIPAMPNEELKRKYIQRFEDKWLLHCLNNWDK